MKPLTIDEAVEELAYSILQGGGNVRRRAAYHPPPQQDLHYVFKQNGRTRQRTDMDRRFNLIVEQGTIQPPETESLTMQRHRFNTRKRKYAWLEQHHSHCTVKQGKCKWENCPG